jgi:acyl carrier protein
MNREELIGALKPIIAPYTTNEEAFGKLTERLIYA